MLKRTRSLTPPEAAGRTATSIAGAHQPENISSHTTKRTHLDTKFLPRKIATAENAAKADKYTPFARLQEMMTRTVATNVTQGDAVVYWMRMQDMRSKHQSSR